MNTDFDQTILESNMSLTQLIDLKENTFIKNKKRYRAILKKLDFQKYLIYKNQAVLIQHGQNDKINLVKVLNQDCKFLFSSFCIEKNDQNLKPNILYFMNSCFQKFDYVNEIIVIQSKYNHSKSDQIDLKITLDQSLKMDKEHLEILFKQKQKNLNQNLFLDSCLQQQKANIFVQEFKDLCVGLKKLLFKKINNSKIVSQIQVCKFQKTINLQNYQRVPINNMIKDTTNVILQAEYKHNFVHNKDKQNDKHFKNIQTFENEMYIFLNNLFSKNIFMNMLLIKKRGNDFEKCSKQLARKYNRVLQFVQLQNRTSQQITEQIEQIEPQTIVIFENTDIIFEENKGKNIGSNNLKSFLIFLQKILQEKKVCFLFVTDNENYDQVKQKFDLTKNFRKFDTENLYQFWSNHFSQSSISFQELKSIQYLFMENDINRIEQSIRPLQLLCQNDNQKFLKMIKKKLNQSNKFETQVPKLTWQNIGGIEHIKQELISSFKFESDSKIKKQKGILLFGPPGTGKTLLAKCIANEFNSSFIAVKGPELLDKYIGESEKNLRQVFQKANQCVPCVLFFDELDSLLPRRGNSQDSSSVTDRMVSQFLVELENSDPNLFLIAATNRPDLLDAAILASGKFDKKIYMGIMNSPEQRVKIIQSLTKDLKLHENCTAKQIEKACPKNITGADFYGIVIQAIQKRLTKQKKIIQKKAEKSKLKVENYIKKIDEKEKKLVIEFEDFQETIEQFTASISLKEIKKYEDLRQQYADLEIK